MKAPRRLASPERVSSDPRTIRGAAPCSKTVTAVLFHQWQKMEEKKKKKEEERNHEYPAVGLPSVARLLALIAPTGGHSVFPPAAIVDQMNA